jgi:TolB-like protein/Tfp pilus assembly protein PilF
MLVQNSGRIVQKEDLLKEVWPDTYVEEATLAQNIFTLRKLLGGTKDGHYIQTIPKRGYRFVARIAEVKEPDAGIQVGQPHPALESVPPAETTANERSPNSLAVLPLLNPINDPNAEYFSDGIVEGIVNALSRLPDVHVKACSTVLRYKGREVDPQETGRELGVKAVLVGRIVQFDHTIATRMELVDVATGWQIWGKEYRNNVSEIHKIEGDIVKDISQNLVRKLTGKETERLFKPRTEYAGAYQIYLKGRYFLSKRRKERYKTAIECFEHAIDLDPNFALAYSGLADSYIQFDFYGVTPPWETIPIARAAAVKAVELDDELAEAHTSMAAVRLVFDRDLEGAERQFKRAIRLNPKYARAHLGYSNCLMEMERVDEALAECKLALELEPLDLEINQYLGSHYLFAHQFDKAIEQLQKTVELGPNFYRARVLLGIAYGQEGLYSQAIEEFLAAKLLEQTPPLFGVLGYAYAMAGKKEEAEETLHDLLEQAKHTYVPPYSIALIYTGLGRKDEAFEWLEKAFIEHGHWRGWLQLTPELDSLRSDPRFTELIRRSFK